MVRGAAFLVVFSLAFGQGQAWADPDDPDALIAQGLKAMRKGNYQAALSAFRRAHQAYPTTRSHIEIGLAEQALHRWVEAEADLAGAMAEPNDAWLESHRLLLEKALADVRSHLGILSVESGPRGAEVKINGEARGVLPLPRPIYLLPGATRVEITASGRRPWSTEAQIKPGELARLAPIFEPLDLPPPMPAAAIAPPVNPARPRLRPLPQLQPQLQLQPKPQPRLVEPTAMRVIGWLALAAGGVAAGGGAYLLTHSQAGTSRRLAGIEGLAVGGAVALSGGVIAVVTTLRDGGAASEHETMAGMSVAGRF
jgi:tetratricopeptide (TPR) repeat protein